MAIWLKSMPRAAHVAAEDARQGSITVLVAGEPGARIKPGDFVLQVHIGAILLAGLAGHINLAALQLPEPGVPAKP
jgi:hypothetical protein